MTGEQLWKDFDEKNHASYLIHLYDRWQDERGYEEFNDYLTALQQRIPSATSISDHPFTVGFAVDDGTLYVKLEEQTGNIVMTGWMPDPEPEQELQMGR